jgi:tyrosyl-tRNA synthetase
MDKFELIKRNTEEIVSEEELKKLLQEKKAPSVYWGTAVTGKPHIAYFLPMLKIADFLRAGLKVKILLSDITGALDGTPWNVLDHRFDYYKKLFPLMLKTIGVEPKNLKFIKSSDINLSADYFLDLLKLSTMVSVNDCKRASAEVVKQSDNPKLSGLIYPLVQALDEPYLGADIQFGGTDQRKILMFARENLPKLKYRPRVEIMNPMIPGLIGKKMSASDPKSKIDLLDDEKIVNEKINNANCVAGEVEDNGILAFLKHVIMIIKQDKKKDFIVKRDKKYGGNLKFKSYFEVEKMFKEKKLHPLDLKKAVAEEINNLLEPIHKNKKILDKLAEKAYGK